MLEQFNEVTGRSYATGAGRSKAHANVIRARSAELYEAARRRPDLTVPPWVAVWGQVCLVVHHQRWLCDQPRNGDPRQTRFCLEWVRPSTLFRPSHLPEYFAEARQRWEDGEDVWLTPDAEAPALPWADGEEQAR